MSFAAVQPATVIQDMIDAAVAGDEVLVPAGEYQGSIRLKDGVILRGAGDTSTILDGQGAAQLVKMGKETAVIGFTLRNGAVLVNNPGHFAAIFECTLEDFSQSAVLFNGGSGVLAHNIVRGGEATIGIQNAAANPLIINNIIESNKIGIQIAPHLIPSIIGNLFRNNETAIAGVGEVKAVIERNLFDGNGTASALGELPEGNEVRAVGTDEFVLQRGVGSQVYRDLMAETYRVAVKDHPIVVYDLHPETGVFDVIGLFPWANFVLSASTLDTRIEDYEAYDVVADQPLNAEYFLQNNERPSVRVHNPELLEKMRERYVLENRYVHGPSYSEEAGGRRVFRRMTNVSQIEVVIPAGYQVVSVSPEGVVNKGADRTWLAIEDMGITHIEVVMEPAGKRIE